MKSFKPNEKIKNNAYIGGVENTMKYMIIQLKTLKVSGPNKLKELLGLKNGIRFGIGTLTRQILAGMKVPN